MAGRAGALDSVEMREQSKERKRYREADRQTDKDTHRKKRPESHRHTGLAGVLVISQDQHFWASCLLLRFKPRILGQLSEMDE